MFGEGPPSNAALHLAPGVDAEAAVARLRADLREHALLVRSNRTLRAEVLAIFEQTFAVTRLLQVMGLVIAAAGVTLSLLVLARERRAELALYRALGASRQQLAALFLGRGLAIGAAGLALGAAGGGALALVLVRSVNPAFFGWTLGVHVPWAGSRRRRSRSSPRRRRRASTLRSWRAGPRHRSSPVMRSSRLAAPPARCSSLALALAAAASRQGFRPADPAHRWSFPADHRAHPGYRNEWWYFTGTARGGGRARAAARVPAHLLPRRPRAGGPARSTRRGRPPTR